MSDAKLRELERRWRETKSVDDEAAYLRERVRVGDLTQERLELAAYCGHEGARKATPKCLQEPNRSLAEWIPAMLARSDPDWAARAVLVLLGPAISTWKLVCHDPAERSRVLQTVETLEAWLAHPTADQLNRVTEAVEAAREAAWHPASLAILTAVRAVHTRDGGLASRALRASDSVIRSDSIRTGVHKALADHAIRYGAYGGGATEGPC